MVWTSNGDRTVYDIGGEPNVQSILDDEEIISERVEAAFSVPLTEFSQIAHEQEETIGVDADVESRLERLGYR